VKRWLFLVLPLIVLLAVSGCGGSGNQNLTKVTLMLDWVPNTNHTGIFAAKENGYFKDAGLDVQIIQPGEVYPEAAVASGTADFGVSFQESVTLARAENVPIVSIAAVIQHNTSGFASSADLKVAGPADFEGKSYGSFGSPFESPTLKVLMESAGADFSQLKIVEIGFNDPLALIKEKKIDMAWIYYGWQGLMAKQQGVDLNIVMMKDYFNIIPDYYTPLVIASEKTIAERPDVVKAFLKALSDGYNYTIQNPDQAADILLGAAPELDKTLVKESQKWLTEYYQAEAPRWGEQKQSIWQNYIDWEVKYGIIKSPISAVDAFTNKFLP
jgi:ABC-type nitrate/sulfonate/bicarbonate transport system substrate-binding protein